MANLVSIIGITHVPFLIQLTRPPRSEWPPDVENMVQRGELFREKLRRAQPDALITIGNDHFHQFFMDNMPAFLLGKMNLFDGSWTNEIREFDLLPCHVPGDPQLAQQILEGALKRGVDFAFSNELKIDHSIIVPLLFVRPEMDLPIVPILTNCLAPPLPTAERFYQVGQVLRAVVDELPGDRRIAAVVSGHLSLDIGGPLQFARHAMDESFDDRAVGWIANADIDGALRECTYEKLTAIGTVTPGYFNFLLALGLANGQRPSHAEGMKRAGSTQPFFFWELASGVTTAA